MARTSRKAEQQKQALVDSVPVEQRKMITQPTTFAYLTGQTSIVQARIQTSIMEQLQGKIKAALERRAKEGFVGDLFDDSDFKEINPGDRSRYLTFTIPYASLGVEPSNYKDIDIAAKAMMSIVYAKDMGDKMRYTVAFPVVDIDKDVPGRRRQNIYLHMSESTAKDFFEIIPYQRYLKEAVYIFSSNYAARIYLLINANKHLGRWVINYEKLRRILLAKYDPATKKAETDRYRDISDFKKRVLEPARREIMDAADRIDCTFDYEFVYPAGKKRGTPEAVVFHIHLTDIGRNIHRGKLEGQPAKELPAMRSTKVADAVAVEITAIEEQPVKEDGTEPFDLFD